MAETSVVAVLEAALLELPGLEKRRSRFGGGKQQAFFVGDREIAHLHGAQALDIRLGKELVRAERQRLRAHPLYLPRKSASPWAEFRLAGEDAIPELVRWVQRAIDAG